MVDLFRAQTAAERKAFIQNFLAWTRSRDGLPDPATLTLSLREPRFREQEANPVRWVGPLPVDIDAYTRDLERYIPEEITSKLGLWALIMGKVNRAERFGVEFGLQFNGLQNISGNDPRTYQEFQELYHTRILADALATLGLQLVPKAPPTVMRTLIQSMTVLPAPIANVIILGAELIGATMFRMLLEQARILLAEQPAVLERVEDLLGQILLDEVSHVHLMRSTLGQAQLRMARWILPMMAKNMVKDIPEISRLFDINEVLRRMINADIEALTEGIHGERLPLTTDSSHSMDESNISMVA